MCRPSIDLPQEPEFFEVPDMADVPHESAHDGIVLKVEVVVAE
jgi:hypothetical protein